MLIPDQISIMLQSQRLAQLMKYFLSLSLVLIIAFNAMEMLPASHAPQITEENVLQATLLKDPEIKSTVDNPAKTLEKSDKSLLIPLLDLYLEQERDLPKAAQVIDQHKNDQVSSKLLELYRAKILARSLDFNTALELIDRLDQEELAILKAGVLISLEDRERAQSFLYSLVNDHTDAKVKSIALSLLEVYRKHDTHRDADGSYLWLLFAKHFASLGEVEISQFLVNKTLEISPEYRDAWLIKSLNELELKQYDQAETSLLNAYQYDPGNVELQYLLAQTYFLQEELDLSEQYFLYSLQQVSDYKLLSLQKLGEIALLKEDFPLATHYFEQIRSEDETNINALSQLSWLYGGKLNDLNKAQELAEILQSNYPEDPQSKELMRWILSKQGELEEASKYLE